MVSELMDWKVHNWHAESKCFFDSVSLTLDAGLEKLNYILNKFWIILYIYVKNKSVIIYRVMW